MLKNITLSAEENLIAAAREQATTERTTLNEQFRRWLLEYASRHQRVQAARAVVEQLQGKLSTDGRKFTRDEMNER